jgi:hypothetical protein
VSEDIILVVVVQSSNSFKKDRKVRPEIKMASRLASRLMQNSLSNAVTRQGRAAVTAAQFHCTPDFQAFTAGATDQSHEVWGGWDGSVNPVAESPPKTVSIVKDLLCVIFGELDDGG